MENIKKQGSEYVYGFVKSIIDKIGPRLPGSEEEAQAAVLIAEEMENVTGTKATVEKFKLAPVASIGAIPLMGWMGVAAALTLYISPIVCLFLSALALIYAVVQIFTYTGAFDFLWPKKESTNVYSEVLPTDGKYEYTLMFSGHNDSSWLWKHSLKNPKTAILKTASGIIGVIILMGISVALLAMNSIAVWHSELTTAIIILYILPVLTLPTSVLLGNYLTWDKTKASPGAMDNMTGVGFSIFMAKYFKENPDKMPKNCRIVCAGWGSEEAGLKGSDAFVKAHANESWLKKTILVNLDSIRDYEHFNVVKGDLWLGTHFDQKLIEMGVASMKEEGRKGGVIVNPVGGCDSTPFSRAGVRTVTLIAQDPNITDYYHTSNDTYQNLDKRTLEDFTAVLFRMTDKIAADLETDKIDASM